MFVIKTEDAINVKTHDNIVVKTDASSFPQSDDTFLVKIEPRSHQTHSRRYQTKSKLMLRLTLSPLSTYNKLSNVLITQ